jgi:hypothetical protein
LFDRRDSNSKYSLLINQHEAEELAMANIYVYRLENPIDWWLGWMNKMEFQANLRQVFYDPAPVYDQVDHALREFQVFERKAFEVARGLGWEGDVSDGPYIAGVPFRWFSGRSALYDRVEAEE